MQLSEVIIELSGRCNTVCHYCTWTQRTVGKGLMDADLARSLLDQAKALGASLIRCHGIGEPLLHPEVVEVLQHGIDLGLNMSISTNGSLLEGVVAERFRRLRGLQLIVAVHGVTPEAFTRRVVANTCDYLVLPNDNAIVDLCLVCCAGAEAHYQKFMQTFLPIVDRSTNGHIFLKQPQTWPLAEPVHGFIPSVSHPRVLVDQATTPYSLARGCSMPDRMLMILADGTCAPCCVGTEDWGLPRADAGLEAVWNSPRLAEIREQWRAADERIPCGSCKKRTDCLQ